MTEAEPSLVVSEPVVVAAMVVVAEAFDVVPVLADADPVEFALSSAASGDASRLAHAAAMSQASGVTRFAPYTRTIVPQTDAEIVAHGWSVTVFQTLEDGYSYFFAKERPNQDSCAVQPGHGFAGHPSRLALWAPSVALLCC